MSVEQDIAALQRRVRELEEQQDSWRARGVDELASGRGIKKFGSSQARLDKNGIQIKSNSSGQDRSFRFVENFYKNFSSTLGGDDLVVFDGHSNSTESVAALWAFKNGQIAGVLPTSKGDGTEEWVLIRPAIHLHSNASDPTALTDGLMWYRSDTDVFRVRANGVTETLAIESVDTETITTGTTLDDTHYVILVNATSAAVTVTLPAVASNSGRIYYIKKIDSSANAVTIDGNASETIDDSTTKVLSAQYDSVTIACDGTEWWIL